MYVVLKRNYMYVYHNGHKYVHNPSFFYNLNHSSRILEHSTDYMRPIGRIVTFTFFDVRLKPKL